ncbi:hypothetical protein GCM10011348_25640 [Marinobacterium nitratireducens]|uniref:Uncharacterized protein n=1 Tax=Marinobacterium nitratireducens TaxID=518897 RepID=A0A917ZJK0_9GAMM|nr:APC family permease [Marinobacterium nitratireducens]GGO82982.1 hypothetical protein GCM10011348_25640 [Marinobacterium nitratireducens]
METGNFSLLDGLLLGLSLTLSGLMLRRNVRDCNFWRATVTPLASIIGSGFLVVVPLLAGIAGTASVVAISGIILLSFWLGSAIRFNIRYDGRGAMAQETPLAATLERLSDLALAFAYVISITFYIRLLSGFVLTGVGAYTLFNADLLATLVLAFIGGYGLSRGLGGLERLEEYSVTIKLTIIAALLAGLLWHDIGHGYDLSGLPQTSGDLWQLLRQLGGMLLIVQGFETSKYLASRYKARLRARSMLLAQVLAGVIYIAFVALAMPLMAPFAIQTPDETAIIGLSGQITLVLPLMLVLAAALSQFSAAIADTIGAGGVVEIESRQRLSARVSYPIIALLAAALTWSTHIFEVVALASRAFAFYYLLQALQAARLAMDAASGRRRYLRVFAYTLLALAMGAIVLFAIPVEA